MTGTVAQAFGLRVGIGKCFCKRGSQNSIGGLCGTLGLWWWGWMVTHGDAVVGLKDNGSGIFRLIGINDTLLDLYIRLPYLFRLTMFSCIYQVSGGDGRETPLPDI